MGVTIIYTEANISPTGTYQLAKRKDTTLLNFIWYLDCHLC